MITCYDTILQKSTYSHPFIVESDENTIPSRIGKDIKKPYKRLVNNHSKNLTRKK